MPEAPRIRRPQIRRIQMSIYRSYRKTPLSALRDALVHRGCNHADLVRSSPWLSRGVRVCWSRSRAPTGSRATRSSGIDYLEARSSTTTPRCSTSIRVADRQVPARHRGVPFPGGAVCVFTYDAARQFERIGPKPPPDIPFSDALVVVPGHLGRLRPLHPSRHADRLRARPNEPPVVEARSTEYERAAADRARQRTERRFASRGQVDAVDGPPDVSRPRRDAPSATSTKATSTSFRSASVFRRGSKAARAFDFYRQIRTRNPSPYMFYIEHGGGSGVRRVAGVSGAARRPRKRGCARWPGRVRAAPIRRDDAAIATELLANEKERAEHVMLVDLGPQRSRRRLPTTGSVHVDELMIIERYSHVMHIVSNVVGRAARRSATRSICSPPTFPAGTVTGAPKIRAMQMIDELEPVAAASTPAASRTFDFDGDMDSCITLRCVAVAGGHGLLAGVGRHRRRQRSGRRIRRRSSHKTGIVRAGRSGLAGADKLRAAASTTTTRSPTTLAHLFGSAGAEVDVIRNDDPRLVDGVAGAATMRRSSGPGPGGRRMRDGCMRFCARRRRRRTRCSACVWARRGSATASAASVVHAPRLMHGKTSEITHDGTASSRACPSPFTATRYHSLCVSHENFPAELRAIAASEDGVIQALAHRDAADLGRAVPSRIDPHAGRRAARAQLPRRARSADERLSRSCCASRDRRERSLAPHRCRRA